MAPCTAPLPPIRAIKSATPQVPCTAETRARAERFACEQPPRQVKMLRAGSGWAGADLGRPFVLMAKPELVGDNYINTLPKR